jgi:hypothetical protein
MVGGSGRRVLRRHLDDAGRVSRLVRHESSHAGSRGARRRRCPTGAATDSSAWWLLSCLQASASRLARPRSGSLGPAGRRRARVPREPGNRAVRPGKPAKERRRENPASANLQVFNVVGCEGEQIDHMARRAGGDYVRSHFACPRRPRTGRLAVLPNRYVRSDIDVNDVEWRIVAIGVGASALRSATSSRPTDRRRARGRRGACGAVAGGVPAQRDVDGCAGRRRGDPACFLPLIAPLTFPTSSRTVSSFLSYVVRAFGPAAHPVTSLTCQRRGTPTTTGCDAIDLT